MGIRILHTADVHLGRSFTHFPEVAVERRRDLLTTFNRIADVALEHKVAAVLVAGDLFDIKEPGPDLVGTVQRWIDRLTAAGIRVAIIPGNHDDVWYVGSVWRSVQFGSAHVFTAATFGAPCSFTVNDTPVHIHGVAYSRVACANPLETLDRTAPGIHVGMMHATVDAPPHFPVLQRFFPLTSAALALTGLDYVALGHIHKAQPLAVNGKPIGRYPGSPEGLDPTETDARHVVLLDFNGGPPKTETIAVNTRTVHRQRVDVSELDAAEIARKLQGRVNATDLVEFELTGTPKELLDCDAMKQRLANDYFWLDISDSTEMVGSDLIDIWMGRPHTIGGRFVRTLHDRILDTADDEEKATLEMALRMGLLFLQKRSA